MPTKVSSTFNFILEVQSDDREAFKLPFADFERAASQYLALKGGPHIASVRFLLNRMTTESIELDSYWREDADET